MQTQDTTGEFILKLWPWLEANKNRLIGALAVILVGVAIGYYVSSARAQKEIDAGQAYTAVVMNPGGNRSASELASDLEQLAGTYAGTAAGQRAQIQAAGALFQAGKYADAQAQFQKYLDAEPTGPFADTAQLGLASSLEAENQIGAAEAAYQRVPTAFPGSVSVAPAEFALGRIAEQQGNLNSAMSRYDDVIHSGVSGSLRDEAVMRETDLKGRIAASSPKSPASPGLQMAPKPPGQKPAPAPQPSAKP